MRVLWRVVLLLWIPVSWVAFGVCALLAVLPACAVWIATRDRRRALAVATFGRSIWWDTTNRIADRALITI